MALNKNNIIVGAARVWLGPSAATEAEAGTVRPTFAAGTKYTAALGASNTWTEVGFTTDGLEIATDPSWGEVEVDQLLDSALIFKDGMSLSVSTTFAEATLENLLIAWGQAASTLSSSGLPAGERELTFEGGSLGEAPLERGLIAVGNGVRKPSDPNVFSERVYHFYRVLSVEATSVGLSRSEAATIPVTFRALPADSGRYGYARERLAVS